MPSSAEKTSRPASRLAIDAMMLGMALLLSYLEAILPLSALIPLPGFRFGWAQIAVTLTFFLVGPLDALTVSGTRVILMGILFGNVSSVWFSVCGAALAYAGLWIGRLFLKNCSFVGLGILCAALHNVGQIAAASVLFGGEVIFSYLPLLLSASVFFGGVGGFLLNATVRRLPATLFSGKRGKGDFL